MESLNIYIERFDVPPVDAYKSTGEFIGTIHNEHEFNKFRIKILKYGSTSDYYFMWGEMKITLNEDGSMSDFPRGLYDHLNQDLAEIFRINQSRKKNNHV